MEAVSSATVIQVIAAVTHSDASTLCESTDLYTDLDLDSLGALEVLVELEDTFGVDISNVAARQIRTIGDLITLLNRTLSAATGSLSPHANSNRSGS